MNKIAFEGFIISSFMVIHAWFLRICHINNLAYSSCALKSVNFIHHRHASESTTLLQYLSIISNCIDQRWKDECKMQTYVSEHQRPIKNYLAQIWYQNNYAQLLMFAPKKVKNKMEHWFLNFRLMKFYLFDIFTNSSIIYLFNYII